MVGGKTQICGQGTDYPYPHQHSLPRDPGIVHLMELLMSAYEKTLNTSKKQTKDELLEVLESIQVDIMGFMESTPIRDHVMALCEEVEATPVNTAIALKLASRLDFADGKEAPNLSKELRVVMSELGEVDDDGEMAEIVKLMNGTPEADAG